MSSVQGSSPTQSFSVEFKKANSLFADKNTDIMVLMQAVGLSTYKTAEGATKNKMYEMHRQNGRAELANQAKTLEEKLKTAAKNASASDTDKLKDKGWTEGKAIAEELAGVYAKLGINSEYGNKLKTGELTLKDIEAAATSTKGVTDSTTSANQMLNLELSSLNNFLNMALNFVTKALENLKTNMGSILQSMGR
jgi:hypothetical protein